MTNDHLPQNSTDESRTPLSYLGININTPLKITFFDSRYQNDQPNSLSSVNCYTNCMYIALYIELNTQNKQ